MKVRNGYLSWLKQKLVTSNPLTRRRQGPPQSYTDFEVSLRYYVSDYR